MLKNYISKLDYTTLNDERIKAIEIPLEGLNAYLFYDPSKQIHLIFKSNDTINENRKGIKVKKSTLGDYIFCFNQNFKNKNFRETIKFARGLKYLLDSQSYLDNDINRFIETCKNFENKKGYVNFSFLNLIKNNKYKFTSGPFANKIFEVIDLQKHKIDILIGKIKTTLKREEFSFRAV